MTHSNPRAALIVNARSRKGRAQFRHACTLLRAAGVDLAEAYAVRKPEQLPDRVRAAVARGIGLVIVGGGDGTMSSAVDLLVGHETRLGVLPLGTANSFARTLGLPLDLPGAVDVIASGVPRAIDLGMIDGDYFANCATLGIAPQIAETVPHGLKAWLGRPGYLLWAARQLARYQPFRVTIGEETVDAVEVRIANGRFHGGVDLVEEAALDSGRIVVQAVIGQSRAGLIASWAASVLRLPQRDRLVRSFEGTSLRIATPEPMPISIDGEVLAHTPVTARVARAAIRVMAPRDGAAVAHGPVPPPSRRRMAGAGGLLLAAGLGYALWRRRRRDQDAAAGTAMRARRQPPKR
ncbi:diacylglycerol/lipid kinase family protein [Sphingomonas morindae]|uniref:diacylglycerol/lipid kinase family protein n=1 Tax=Sphingomonas morindae TaxID=1541170 RepID=UPI00349E4905